MEENPTKEKKATYLTRPSWSHLLTDITKDLEQYIQELAILWENWLKQGVFINETEFIMYIFSNPTNKYVNIANHIDDEVTERLIIEYIQDKFK